MAFTQRELASITNASLDYYLNKGKTFGQSIQKKPLLDRLQRRKKTFSGGKGGISVGVKGTYGAGGTNDGLKGYTHNDTVSFYTPENIQRANYAWREMHIGISVTHTELKIDGISVTDESGEGKSKHSKRDMHVLVGLLEDKLEDLGEQYASTLNALLWGDGSGDAKALAGIQGIVVANPAAGTVGGINRAVSANSWWKNRARTAAHAKAAAGNGPVTSATAHGGALLEEIQIEHRQLTRYGGSPTLALCGSDFIGAMERETRANGSYSTEGFAKGGNDFAVTGLNYVGQKFIYDPTLDDMSLAKRCYWIDERAISLMAMEGEWNRTHTPSRAPNQFVLHRSITCTGQMIARQCNSSLVIDIT